MVTALVEEEAALGEVSSMAEPEPQRLDWRGRAGVYCVAYGPAARKCAVRLIASVRRYMPGLPVCLVSDTPLGAGEDAVDITLGTLDAPDLVPPTHHLWTGAALAMSAGLGAGLPRHAEEAPDAR